MSKLKNTLRGIRFWLALPGALLVFFALLYDYNTSSLEYLDGVVTEVKAGGKSHGRSGTVRYCNFKIRGDTTTYGYYFGVPGVLSLMGIEHKNRIIEGDKVGFWFKPDEKKQYELYLADDYESMHYKIYSLKKISRDKAYIINIRGLSVNGKIILKPQLYNYVKKGMYYPMLFAILLTVIVPLTLIVSIFTKPKKKEESPR